MSKTTADYDLQYEKRPQYLYATLACQVLDPSVALAILGDIMAHAADQRCKRILVQCDLSSIERDQHLLEAMLELASMRSGSRIAFVSCRHEKGDHPAIGEDFRLFDEEAEAEEWLLEARDE